MAENPAKEKVEPRKPSSAPSFTIQRPQSGTRYLKLLVYGDYGIGKTTLAGSAALVPSMQDVLMINAEAGDLSISNVDNLDQVRVKTFKEVARVAEFLQAHCKYRDEGDTEKLIELESKLRGEEVTEPRMYRTIMVDSLGEVETYSMYQLLGITDKTKLDDESDSPEWAEYKKNYSMIQRLVRRLRDLPMHVIFTCPVQFTQDESKRMIYSPNLTGKLAKEVQGFMDMVGFFVLERNTDGNQERRLYVQPVGRFSAKNRFPAFKGNFITVPEEGGMEEILKKMGLKVEAPAS